MKADRIIKNAKVFTANPDHPQAAAIVVKDGRFVYVGDESGLSDYEGEVTDLGGRFVMPGIIDSHVHVTMSVGFEYTEMGERIECEGKENVLAFIADHIKENPGQERYRFILERAYLKGEEIVKEDLDRICPDSEILIMEGESHSIWVNSKLLAKHGVTDETPDVVPGLSYFVRKDGHVTGNIFESLQMRFLFDHLKDDLTDEMIEEAVTRWIEFSKEAGVCAVFDSGFPEQYEIHERVYACLCKMDREGKLPIYIDGCYCVTDPKKLEDFAGELRRFNREYNTEHLKVHTLKLFMDGTLKIETAALVTPYADTGVTGVTAQSVDQLVKILRILNEEGMDLHLHTVGEQASRDVLDAVEIVKNELGDRYRVKVTCAHLEIQDDADLERFAKLGVYANYSPWWHCGNMGGNPYETWRVLIGDKRAANMYRCKTIWDTGAIVTWSSDEVFYGYFTEWNPYLGMEVGMTRQITEKTRQADYFRTVVANPPLSERMSIEEMILGYTINGAKQLGIEASKGSIEVGKDADFLVFDKDLLTAEKEGFSNNFPEEVYFSGVKMETEDTEESEE